MMWPPPSPDLKHIKKLWSIVKWNIYEGGRQSTSERQLWDTTQTSCNQIQTETLPSLTGSMDARIVKLLQKKESYIKMLLNLIY